MNDNRWVYRRIKERTGLAEMHTDGGYNSPEVDQVMRQHQVEQVQTQPG